MRPSNQHENKRFVVEIVFSYSDISFFVLYLNIQLSRIELYTAIHANVFVVVFFSLKKLNFFIQLKHTRKLT